MRAWCDAVTTIRHRAVLCSPPPQAAPSKLLETARRADQRYSARRWHPHMRAQPKPPWPGAGKASQRSSDEVLSAARGCSVEERGLSFRVLDLPHLGAVTDAADLEKRTRISKLTDVELDAWISDRSLQPSRVGMSRAERELLVMRVRKLPCDAEAAECALDAFTADAAGSIAEASLTGEVAACADAQQRYEARLRQLDAFLTEGTAVWLSGLSKNELNARWGVVAGQRTCGGAEARYPVELTDDGPPGTGCIAVRPINLRPGRPAAER